MARVLTSHHCGLGWCHMWVEFVVGVHPCSKGFSWDYLVFHPFAKTNIPNSNLTWKQWIGRATLWNVAKFPFICLFVIGFLTVVKYLRMVIYHVNKLCWTS